LGPDRRQGANLIVQRRAALDAVGIRSYYRDRSIKAARAPSSPAAHGSYVEHRQGL